jgi:hypothetical protein
VVGFGQVERWLIALRGDDRDQVRLGGRLSISHWTQDVRGDAVVVDMQASLVGRAHQSD